MKTSPGSATLLVADSFRVRVRAGVAEVRGFESHVERFRRGVAEALHPEHSDGQPSARQGASDPSPVDFDDAARGAASGTASSFSLFVSASPLSDDEELRLDRFLNDARASIAGFGEGFPRLELWRGPDGDIRFECALRPLPQLMATLRLRSAITEPPASARIKGPNIADYAALNETLAAEGVLVGADGRVREGATTSLLFWADERDSSGRFIDLPDRVASVTESILCSAAAKRLVGVKPERSRSGHLLGATPAVAELQGSEIWAVNALHGIRRATHLDGVALPSFNARRLGWFMEALDRSWEPVERP